MTKEEGAAAIEAILFTMGDSVTVAAICNALDEDLKDVRDQIAYLKKKYSKADSGISLIELEDSIQLCTKSEMYEYLIKVAKTPKKITLTDALMETLSIIAYKQPITRLDVERIRGVNSDHAVNRLVEFNLVQELGRLDAPGRPLLFGTTEQFLRSFGVKSLDDLPSLDAVRVEEFKQEAEQEISVKLDI
ncbi:SMC-Scp complex subunit ScpB [Butyrivibrio sp. WCE2006]|uniref:SMC-Scp complex subunit ScpB n=1 Tax=Butyrivibrio sp. WCE2006 TaxID=1410611 RepID=UPI0005D1B246|nr:SMC-Scp complex subunit ScpB [Butyrivibrio sp. WCE2006]